MILREQELLLCWRQADGVAGAGHQEAASVLQPAGLERYSPILCVRLLICPSVRDTAN